MMKIRKRFVNSVTKGFRVLAYCLMVVLSLEGLSFNRLAACTLLCVCVCVCVCVCGCGCVCVSVCGWVWGGEGVWEWGGSRAETNSMFRFPDILLTFHPDICWIINYS